MRYPNFPLIGDEIALGGLTPKKRNKGTQRTRISNLIEIQNFESLPRFPLAGKLSHGVQTPKI